jgi:ABC-type spermidine/putrescine transport system permease subunit I
VLLFLIPMGFMLVFSFLRTDPNFNIVVQPNLDNFARFINVPTYLRTFGKTLLMAALVTAAGLALAMPFAYFLVRYVSHQWQRAILLAVVVPFWTSYLLRVYAWQAILGEHGALNQVLQRVGLIHEPSALFIYNDVGVFIVLTYLYFPFAALALYAALEKFDFAQFNAAQDLGARPDQAFRHILLPQIRAGIITACIFVFIPILGEFLTPALVGGASGSLIANLVVNFFRGAQYAEGSALAIVIAVFVTVVLIVFRRYLRVEDVVARG